MIALQAPRPVVFTALPEPYRACVLCLHGSSTDGNPSQRVCTQQDARLLHGQHPPVHLVRARGGACGPDALRLDFPGLNR